MFKKFIAIILIIGLISTTIPIFVLCEEKLDCAESMVKGEMDAKIQHKAGGWFAGGIAGGTLLGLIGGGIVVAIAAVSDPKPTNIPNKEIIDENCYISGYSKKAKNKNVVNAIGGGLVGTAIAVTIAVIIMSSSSSSYY